MNNKILIIDDDELVAASLKKVLIKLGHNVEFCLEGEKALQSAKELEPDLILLDIYLGSVNGLELLKDLQKEHPFIPVVMITGYSDIKMAVSAIKSGAVDFLLKPIDLVHLQNVISKTFEGISLKNEVERLQEIIRIDTLTKDFFGKNKKMRKVIDFAEKLAKSPDTTVLIDGESGTGKEMVAKYIHQQSARNNQPFIQINCSAIPKELAESELFGHEKGAFTGAAQKTKLGKFELAKDGTILLDEIGELSLELQAKLLRVLQEKTFYRVGGEKEISVDVRVIAATNKNLEEEVKKGNFREDLFYRLNVVKVEIPPLRERKDDIPLFSYYFLNELSTKLDKKLSNINPSAMQLLKSYEWKGNVRELRNVMERAVLLAEGNELTDRHFYFLFGRNITDKTSQDKFEMKIPPNGISVDVVLKSLILQTLKITKGNQVKAAKILGLSRSKLRYRMEQLEIEVTKNIS